MPEKRHRKLIERSGINGFEFPLSVLAQKMSKNRFALATANFTQRSRCIFTLFVLLKNTKLTTIKAVTFAKPAPKMS